eukprot:gene1651-1836_t
MDEPNPIRKDDIAAYIVNLMALIRSLPGVSDTYKDLTKQIINASPAGYARVDIVADTYRKESLKNPECLKCGHSSKVLISLAKSKIPRNFSDFLKNGENKSRMIKIIKDEMAKEKHAFLEKLKCNEILFSVDKLCIPMTGNNFVKAKEVYLASELPILGLSGLNSILARKLLRRIPVASFISRLSF